MGVAPYSKVGNFTPALYDEAKKKGWVIASRATVACLG
jgi:hypothetical protein